MLGDRHQAARSLRDDAREPDALHRLCHPPRCGYARRVSARPRPESFEMRHEEVIMRYLFAPLFIGGYVTAASVPFKTAGPVCPTDVVSSRVSSDRFHGGEHA